MTVTHFSLALKPFVYLAEANVLLYFAQSVLVKTSTNPILSKAEEKNHNVGNIYWAVLQLFPQTSQTVC